MAASGRQNSLKGLKKRLLQGFALFPYVLFSTRDYYVGTRGFFVRQISRVMLVFMYSIPEEDHSEVLPIETYRREHMRRYCKRLGDAGEDFAAKTLEDQGYEILERKFRTRRGEIDLIASREGVIHFIEVKTRTGDDYGYPAEAVTPEKQTHIRRVADTYLANRRMLWRSVSIDVVEVTFNMIENCV